MKFTHQLKSGEMFALTIFLVAAFHRNFRQAAVELNMTPSAVSHAIKNLEDRLDVRLFNRTTRNVSLTDAGHQLYSSLQPAMENVAIAVNQLDAFREKPSGILRINASEGAVRMILKPILKKFLDSNPFVHLDIVCNGRLVNIVEDKFDAGIRLRDSIPQEMVAIRLTENEKFVAVASPEYLIKYGVPKIPYDLYTHNCIRFRFESGEIFQWEFNLDGRIKKFDVNGTLTLTDQHLMVEAAVDGIGIAFVPMHLAHEYLVKDKIGIVLEEFSPSYDGLCLYYPGHRHVSNALQALINMIRSDHLL
ncbi:LysR family transcriptional regulator [Acinetobacter sp. ANC 3882]|uniref:LysR family transcriptional regulator n=1 Tax=Acinetobacter sp. ANC 3882 TaxID=2923423 RepID=UPI001F4B889F|nr:LysR family transcriptional regulator [Acinetobacter sp. ANC 3882]MCH7314472.1 LysR family transcriptional regulator [Acinetobacter sp. ANC 3882]